MGLDGNGRVVAFGDFNGDQFLDVLRLDVDQQTISVHHWSHADFVFKEAATFHHPRRVQNIVPGDFTHSGKLDLLVMSESQTKGQLDMTVYPASISGGFDISNPLTVPPSTLSQPISIDADGDLKIDLLGITPSNDDSKAPFQLWQNVWNASQPNSLLFKIITPGFHGPQCTLANPHSNAVVDLNGDCLADVFLVCDDGRGGRTFQIWVNNKQDGFSLAQEGDLPSGLQTISFADIDRDGTIDMVFTTCYSVSPSSGLGSDCVINIAYNSQLGLCSSSTDTGIKKGVRTCRPHDDLCTVDSNFKFNLNNSPDNDVPLYSDPVSLLATDTSHTPPLPLPFNLGDANLDGFPDLLLIIGSGKDRIPSLIFSVPCAAGVVGCSAGGSGRRGWALPQKGADPLSTISDARGASFLDLDEDGTLDIMVQRTGEAGHGNIVFIQNNFYYDAFFLKAIGRTNNYIENFFVGSTVHAKEHYINMEGVIPNSKVVILPSANEDEAWKRELFLRPGEWIPWVTVTVVAGTALLAIIVFVLHLNEKREDELERRRASHHINFDAL
ncbi:hypothetical protein DXG01_004152 [Tephrocybe rancida]|nr:hypothetical protein DXG01_004152 [Tephrocybe rancida]